MEGKGDLCSYSSEGARVFHTDLGSYSVDALIVNVVNVKVVDFV